MTIRQLTGASLAGLALWALIIAGALWLAGCASPRNLGPHYQLHTAYYIDPDGDGGQEVFRRVDDLWGLPNCLNAGDHAISALGAFEAICKDVRPEVRRPSQRPMH